MLKVRVMPTLLYKDHSLVKGRSFDSWRPVGALMQAIKVYELRQVDELVFLDVTATREGRRPDFALVDDFADECFMPLTVGGGVRTPDDVGRLLAVGADKVAVNTALLERPEDVREMARRYGSQCVVASIDARRVPDGAGATGGGHEVMVRSGTQPTGRDPVALAQAAERLGAGEILVTSIDRDGTLEGYDLDLVGQVARAVGIPVIASGGAGSYDDMALALEAGASAVAAAAMFHFTHQTPLEAKQHLRARGFAARL